MLALIFYAAFRAYENGHQQSQQQHCLTVSEVEKVKSQGISLFAVRDLTAAGRDQLDIAQAPTLVVLDGQRRSRVAFAHCPNQTRPPSAQEARRWTCPGCRRRCN